MLSRMLLASLTALTLLLGPSSPSIHAAGSPRLIRAAARSSRRDAVYRAGFVYTDALRNPYRNNRFGFDIRYPDGWEVQHALQQQGGGLAAAVFFLSPFDEKTDVARENINLVVEDLPSSAFSLETYTTIALANVEAVFTRYTLTASQELLLQGMRAQRVTYEGGFGDGEPVAFEQIWFLRDGRAHVWTLAATPQTFDAHSLIFRQMMETLNFRT